MRNPLINSNFLFFTVLVNLALVFVSVSQIVNAQQAPDMEIRIGLRAHKGIEIAMRTWQPTADYLSNLIPGYSFTMVPYAHIDQLTEAARRNEFHFILTNPSSYIEIELLSGGSRILTLKNKRRGKGYTQFGSVIFTLAGRNDINSFADIKNKTLMAVSQPAFGGWRVAWQELLKNGVDPHADLKKLLFADGNQTTVVKAILNKQADVGVVRTDMLERLQAQGLIKLTDFKVIGTKYDINFPFLRSTPLYPEWPLVKLKPASLDLAESVSAALLQMPETHPAARAGQYVGWSVPLNYTPVHDLLKQLRVGPYKNFGDLTIQQIFEKYWLWITVITLFISFLLVVTSYALNVNSKLRKAKKELNSIKLNLEQQVLEHADRLSQTNSHFRTIVTSIADGVVTIDTQHSIITMNPAIENTFNYSRMDLLQNCITEIIPDLYAHPEDNAPAMLNQTLELVGRRKNNSSFPVEVKFTETELEGVPMFVGVIRDISEQKRHERMKDEFISTVSHELRTPLTSINGSLSLILGGAVGGIPPQVSTLIELANRNCERLVALINDILDFSKFESGAMSFELKPVSVNKILETAVKLNTGYAEKYDVQFKIAEISDDLSIYVDENRILQVISNLLSNAAKFSPRGSIVKMSASIALNGVRIAVIDNGKGIDKKFQHKIFDKFTQVDSSDSRVVGGTGLGLNISKLIVEKHGGKIYCNSEIGKGSTFFFDLPTMIPISRSENRKAAMGGH